MKKLTMAFDVIVAGGGASGMLSAGTAASCGSRVLLLERNPVCGKKLRITGKGRCNVCNDCSPENVLKNVPTGGRFLYSSVWGFPPEAVKSFFEDLGVPLKTERGNRVFPVSDRAADVAEALERWMLREGVTVRQGNVQALILRDGRVEGVQTEREQFFAPHVILAMGGESYPGTGSTGKGYDLAAQAGHTVSARSGALVPLELREDCRALAGLSLRNTGLTLWGNRKKPIYRDFGELMFMRYGVSGPTVLSASCHMEEKLGPFVLELDLKPALDREKLDVRLLRDFGARKNERIFQGLRGVLPAQMVPLVLQKAGIPEDAMVRDVTKEMRRSILDTMKGLRLDVTGKRPVAEAIITHGGVKLSEIDPATMESRRCPGLYIVGELLDCDAYTGGFNLQIAWSTGYAAGRACGKAK